MEKIGIYIHIPFCVRKCDYCDFISYAGKEEKMLAYVDSLQKEIEERAKNIRNEKKVIDTIYIGGGTPSFLPLGRIQAILETIKKEYSVKKDAEITIEVNPGTVSKEKLQEYRKCGCNRISIGLQATRKKTLERIGRIHTFEQFLKTYQMAKEVGFSNQNVDIMIGLPEQNCQEVEESIHKVLEIEPKHISIYSLIVEEGTPLEKKLAQGKYKLPDEEEERNMYWKVKQMLEQSGYIHYEISNFAKPRLGI